MTFRAHATILTIFLCASVPVYAGTPRVSRSDFRQKVSIFVSHRYPASPLVDQALQDDFYDAGEKNGIDPRFLVAMSAQETGLYTDGCAVRYQNNNMFNWFWNPTSTRCRDSAYETVGEGVANATLGLRRWIKKLTKISQSFNAYDFVLNPDRRYCSVACADCLIPHDPVCAMSSSEITEEVAGQCSASIGTCIPSCSDADGCDRDCKCWSPNVASFMEELGGDPCNIWFDSSGQNSTERACAGHSPSPPSECLSIAVQPSLSFGAVPTGACIYRTVTLQNQATCETLSGTVSVTQPFYLSGSAELKVKQGQATSILVGYCGAEGVASGALTLSTNRGSAVSSLTANGCNTSFPEVCDNDADDNCDELVDEVDPQCQVVPPVCGNGIREAGESCDDGNTTSLDCCDANCIAEDLGTISCGVGACENTVPRCAYGESQTCTPKNALMEGPFGDTSCTNDSDDDCNGFTDDEDGRCVLSGLNYPEALVIDNQSIFYGDHAGDVHRVAKSGGDPALLGHVPYYVSGLTVDDQYIYVASTLWNGGGGVFRIGKNTGPAQVLAYANQPDDIQVDMTHLYWSENNGGTGVGTYRIPKGGGDRESIGFGTLHGVLTQDDQNIFFRSYTYSWNNIWRASKSDLSLERIATLNNAPFDIAVSSDAVYWADFYTGTIYAVSRIGGTPSVLVSGLSHPTRLELDGPYLYWIEREFYHGGSLKRLDTQRGGIEVLRSGLDGPYDFVIDVDAAYVVEYGSTNSSGSLRKIKK